MVRIKLDLVNKYYSFMTTAQLRKSINNLKNIMEIVQVYETVKYTIKLFVVAVMVVSLSLLLAKCYTHIHLPPD